MTLTISQKIWIGYDNLPGVHRFFTFLVFMVIPYSVLAAINFTWGVCYIAPILLWRHLTMTRYKKVISNGKQEKK